MRSRGVEAGRRGRRRSEFAIATRLFLRKLTSDLPSRFVRFHDAFEEVEALHQKAKLDEAEVEMRERLKGETLRMVVPTYTKFLAKHQAGDFSKSTSPRTPSLATKLTSPPQTRRNSSSWMATSSRFACRPCSILDTPAFNVGSQQPLETSTREQRSPAVAGQTEDEIGAKLSSSFSFLASPSAQDELPCSACAVKLAQAGTRARP